ncbi:hypothetical protein [Streptomyces sp. HPF1205]|uniref:hypothetical protein n=1 Tax=Streptomyces sp. HPF1205 TaxID=2873262 RepID=UPI001CEDAD68|nr:hypothetical protein [Streptomyces sp. HPF1205]
MVRRTGFVLAADGSYGACLAEAEPADGDPGGGRWFAERWTLDGPEPYAVSLAGARPEDVGSARVLPLPDGRVLVMRRADDRCDVVLAYPTGPRTGEVPVGSLAGTEVRLLPPSPAAGRVFALVPGAGRTTEIWQVHGDGVGPARVMTVAGRCTGGVWLDRGGRLLALDRELDGRTKTAAVDLHTGEVSALLQITEDSDDRLLLAEPDSGLLVLRSDAPGRPRLGWGVLGSRRPVRFPDSLHFDGALLTPVAAQPGQILSPDSCAVALRAQVPGGAESLVLWRPGEGRPHFRPAPAGWLGPTALWLPGRPLCLPYAVPDWPCGLAPYDVPPAGTDAVRPAPAPRPTGVRGRVARPPAVLPLQQAPLASAAAG